MDYSIRSITFLINPWSWIIYKYCCTCIVPVMIIFMSFLRLFAIGSQLSPEVGSSGIEMLETDMFKLHCFQTLTGLFFSCCKGKLYSVIECRILCWTKLQWLDRTVFSFCRYKVHYIGWPSTVWYWCPPKKDLWDLLRLCTEESFLLFRNAYQVCHFCVCYNFVLCMQSNLLCVTKNS